MPIAGLSGIRLNTLKGYRIMSTEYVNTENEKIEIRTIPSGKFEGQKLLVIHSDDLGDYAPLLLDEGTVKWLLLVLKGMCPTPPLKGAES